MSLEDKKEVPETSDQAMPVSAEQGGAAKPGAENPAGLNAGGTEEGRISAQEAGPDGTGLTADDGQAAGGSEEDRAGDGASGTAEKKSAKKKKEQKDEEPLDVKAEIISWIKTFAVTIGIVLFVLLFIILNAQIPTESMESTIMTGDRLIGLRFAYWFSEPKRGDVILFKFPLDESRLFIKRVIGLPGETVTIEDGHVYIDDSDVPLEETYLNEEWVYKNDGLVYEIPEDSYFVMGDNRNHSADSRSWAEMAMMDPDLEIATEEDAMVWSYVPEKNIRGKAVFIYFSKYKHDRILRNPFPEDLQS